MSKDWHELISQPEYKIKLEEDVWVTMRDGVRLAVDVYRPNAEGKFPALLSFSEYGKEQQKLPTDPVWQPLDALRGNGGHECGEQWYFVPRGYVHVIPDTRGVGKSEGDMGDFRKANEEDGYDLVEWIAAQPWCNGNVGMLGMSGFAVAQYRLAAEHPPHLKAIFPFEAVTDRYRQGSLFHGGIFNFLFRMQIRNHVPERIHGVKLPASYKEFSKEEIDEKVKELQRNPDIRCNPNLYLITVSPEMNPGIFDLLLHPFDGPYYQRISGLPKLEHIEIPSYTGSRWNGWAVHLAGAFDSYEKIKAAPEKKKMLLIPCDNYGGMDRPFHEVQDVCLRWYDHWLKDRDTGLMDEPPITLFVQGVNRWRYENEWPLKETEWKKLYLREKGALSFEPPEGDEAPQVFTNDPWANPDEGFQRADALAKAGPVPRAVYDTGPLTRNTEVTGPIALYWHAAIESRGLPARSWKGSPLDGIEVMEPVTNDTDWYLKLIDVDVDGSERVVSEGWLKASRYELDEEKSRPYLPHHPHTRNLPIEPGEVILYASDIRASSNVFLAGHRIRLEIAGQDRVQHICYHLPHMAKVTHTIYSTGAKPSYILLPLIPAGYQGAGEPEYPPEGPFRIAKYRRPS